MNWLTHVQEKLNMLEAPTVKELRTALQQLQCTPNELASYITEPHEGIAYGRNVIYRSTEVEAIVIQLPPAAETAIHSHGESVGCALIVEGRLNNVLYETAGYGMAKPIASFQMPAGSYMAAPHGQIHQMSNDGYSRVVSLHLYAPPLTGMRQYVQEEKANLDYVI